MTAAVHRIGPTAVTVSVERSPGGGNGWCVSVPGAQKWIVGYACDAFAALWGLLTPVHSFERERTEELMRKELRVRRRVEVVVELAP